MSIKSRSILKGWFETGDKPTQDQFWDWLDSFFHLNEDTLPISKVDNLQDELDGKVDNLANQLIIYPNATKTLETGTIRFYIDGSNLRIQRYNGVSWDDGQVINFGASGPSGW